MAKLLIDVGCVDNACGNCPHQRWESPDEACCLLFFNDAGFPENLDPGPGEIGDDEFYRCPACLAAERAAEARGKGANDE